MDVDAHLDLKPLPLIQNVKSVNDNVYEYYKENKKYHYW